MGRKEDMAHRAITGIWDNVVRAGGIGEPPRTPLFRRIWFASLLSNFGLLIQAVGAAWSMTQLTPAADMVALVQTALMMPVMLVSLAAGPIAALSDRGRVSIPQHGGEQGER